MGRVQGTATGRGTGRLFQLLAGAVAGGYEVLHTHMRKPCGTGSDQIAPS
jgi:outer membrane lipoprotein SlyB